MKYYFVGDAIHSASACPIPVTIYDQVANLSVAVCQSDDPRIQAVLDKLCMAKSNRFIEISEEDYNRAIKKKPPTPNSSNPWNKPTPPAATPLKGNGAAVVVESSQGEPEEEKPVEIKTQLDSVEEALGVAPLEPAPQLEPVEPPRPRKRK